MGEDEFVLIRHHLERALHGAASWVGDHDVYAALADVAAMQRDEAALWRYAPPAEELASRHGHELYHAIAHRAWGVAHRLAGEYVAAETRLTQALALFEHLGARWQSGRTCAELGELALAQANHAAARGFFVRALAAFDAVRAVPDSARVQSMLARMR